MPQEHGNPPVAAPEDVLAVMTRLMYSDKPADQLKAADMLAKHHGLLTPQEESGFEPELIAEIEAAVAEIAQDYNDPQSPATGSLDAADAASGTGSPVVRAGPADG
nr:hypothetical protein [Clostridia bacterium]